MQDPRIFQNGISANVGVNLILVQMPLKGGIDADQTTPQMREKMEKWVPSDQQTYRRNELYRQARQFLSDILADGPQPYSTIVARATEAGISLASLLTQLPRSKPCFGSIKARKSYKCLIFHEELWPCI